ncbi:hypothetical protein GAYE_SCF18G3843 [Galdieria yellowstonensis]|uniref:Protein-S-isoprenylcysteine O-methyltransferase n=1 Tax=Galdieria yellowstonensis TaxID=3028027 RepID=A0AAV9IF24_9RHOD|nr:hypothetical protein GAYE_SCF18G3843 [Galdieria yellowstonensis]
MATEKKQPQTKEGSSSAKVDDSNQEQGVNDSISLQWKEKVQELTNYFKNIQVDNVLEQAKATAKVLWANLAAGEALSRGEPYAVVQFIVLLLILREPGSTDALINFLLGPFTLFTGLFIVIKAAVDLGKEQLTPWPAPVPQAKLRTEGLYRFVRHPMYLGVVLASFGFSGTTGSSERLLLSLGLLYLLIKKVQVEETFLENKFGEQYKQYCEKVPYRIIPKVF